MSADGTAVAVGAPSAGAGAATRYSLTSPASPPPPLSPPPTAPLPALPPPPHVPLASCGAGLTLVGDVCEIACAPMMPPPSPPPSPLAPPPPPSPPPEDFSPVVLVGGAPDHQQPWVVQGGIAERNLCAPTALSSQLAALHSDGAILQVPTGTNYATGVGYDSTHGWQDFVYDGPGISNPTKWADAPSTTQPSFDWFLNVNNGAQDVANTVGASIDSIVKGAEAFYNRTPLAEGGRRVPQGRAGPGLRRDLRADASPPPRGSVRHLPGHSELRRVERPQSRPRLVAVRDDTDAVVFCHDNKILRQFWAGWRHV